MRRRIIGIIGGAEPTAHEEAWAERVGRLLGERDVAILTGGLGGVMEAASRGAHGAGGLVIGVVPTGQAESCNRWVEISIATGIGDARNVVIANSADGFIAIGGSLGTLSEIAFALKRGKPVVGLGTWALDETRLAGAGLICVTTPEEAVTTLLTELGID